MLISDGILRRIIEKDPALVMLDLSSQEPALQSQDIEILVDTIKKSANTTLVTLILNENAIDDDGAIKLNELTTIKALQLADNNLTDKGAIALANEANGLTSLELSTNKIGDAGFKALLKKPTLRVLTIGYNEISNEAALEALRGKSLENLNAIYLGGNNIEKSTLESIDQYMKRDRRTEEKKQHKVEKSSTAKTMSEITSQVITYSASSNNFMSSSANAGGQQSTSLSSPHHQFFSPAPLSSSTQALALERSSAQQLLEEVYNLLDKVHSPRDPEHSDARKVYLLQLEKYRRNYDALTIEDETTLKQVRTNLQQEQEKETFKIK